VFHRICATASAACCAPRVRAPPPFLQNNRHGP
jgi:hypothetical protein